MDKLEFILLQGKYDKFVEFISDSLSFYYLGHLMQ